MPRLMTTILAVACSLLFGCESEENPTKALLEACAGRLATPTQVEGLIKAGADVNAEDEAGYSPLMNAALFNQNTEVTTMLIKAGAEVNARYEPVGSPLIFAASYNPNPEVTATLIKAGAVTKMDEQYTQWLKDHPEAQSPAPPEMAGEEL